MASFHLAFGVVCVALVPRFLLDKRLTPSQLLGFGLLAIFHGAHHVSVLT